MFDKGVNRLAFNCFSECCFNPFPHIDAFWRLCSRWIFENIMTKEEIAQNVQFLLLPQCFPLFVISYPLWRFSMFLQNKFKVFCCIIVVWGKGLIKSWIRLFLDHLRWAILITFCPSSGIRPALTISFKHHLLPNSQGQFLWNITGLFLWLASFKVVQRFKVHWELWLLRHQKGGKRSNL